MVVVDNTSYTFNAYYQALNQKEKACDFHGLVLPTETDTFTPTCNFTIQIQTRTGVADMASLRRSTGLAARVLTMLQLLARPTSYAGR
jgi:glucan endo-1,3-beta-glucosidase 5/6